MGNELDKLQENNTFIVPPSEDKLDFGSLPVGGDTFVVPFPEGTTFYVTQRSRKH